MSSDMPLQVWDIEGKGRDDVYIGVQGNLLVLDGRTGKEIKRWELPKGLGWADCITFANFRGLERARDIIVKTRHGPMWAYTDDWRLLWQWAPPAGYHACHHPQPVDVDGDGRPEVVLLAFSGEPVGTEASPGAPRIRIYKSDKTPQLKDPPRRTFNFTLYN